MTDADRVLKRLLEAATPGPWTWWDDGVSIRDVVDDAAGGTVADTERKGPQAEANAAYIAAANPQVVLDLLARLDDALSFAQEGWSQTSEFFRGRHGYVVRLEAMRRGERDPS